MGAAKGTRPEPVGRPTFLVPRRPRCQIHLYKGPDFLDTKESDGAARGPTTDKGEAAKFIHHVIRESKLPDGAYISQTKDNEKKKDKPKEVKPTDDVVPEEEPEKIEVKDN